MQTLNSTLFLCFDSLFCFVFVNTNDFDEWRFHEDIA